MRRISRADTHSSVDETAPSVDWVTSRHSVLVWENESADNVNATIQKSRTVLAVARLANSYGGG